MDFKENLKEYESEKKVAEAFITRRSPQSYIAVSALLYVETTNTVILERSNISSIFSNKDMQLLLQCTCLRLVRFT